MTIGGLFGLTGYASFAGEASRNGFLMAIEDSGVNLPYVVEDFESNPTKAVTAAKKLIEVNKVTAVIGPEWAEFNAVVAPIADTQKTLFISPWLRTEAEWSYTPYLGSAMPSERLQLRKLISYLMKNDVDTLSLMYSDNAWSIENIAILKNEIEKTKKIKIVSEHKLPQNSKDYKTEITKLNVLKSKGIYLAMAEPNDHGILLRQLRELNVASSVYSPFVNGENQNIINEFRGFVENTVYPAPKENKNLQRFNEKYENRFGSKPEALSAATAYDMTTLVLRAIKQGAKTSNEIISYLRSVKDYDGYSNKIAFDENLRVASEEVVIKQIKNGIPVILEE